MTKRILILKGSPRERGNSSVLAERLADSAREAGADVESIHLHSLDICDECAEEGLPQVQITAVEAPHSPRS